MFVLKGSRLGTVTNNSGGIQGGITNGESIVFRVAFKPPATIGRDQQTADYGGQEQLLAAKGRHDPCVVPRAVPIVEAMAALVLADAAMAQLARLSAAPLPPAAGEQPGLSQAQLQRELAREIRLREDSEARVAELLTEKRAALDLSSSALVVPAVITSVASLALIGVLAYRLAQRS